MIYAITSSTCLPVGTSSSVLHGDMDALAHAMHSPQAVFSSLVFRDMDGFELCGQLRAMPETPDSLIAAVTGYCEPDIERKVLYAGFNAYLFEPVSLQDFPSLLAPLRPNARPVVRTGSADVLLTGA